MRFRRKPYYHSPEVQRVIERIHHEFDKWQISSITHNSPSEPYYIDELQGFGLWKLFRRNTN